MKSLNLSEWAITHRPLVLFMILLLSAAGIFAYLNLGRAEDPNFTIKVMVVNVAWPGATATEMQAQVADKIEKKLQELPFLDRVARQNSVVAGGAIDTSSDRINLRVTGAFSGVDAIAAVPVQANGQVFRLGDIATVKRGYEDPASFIVRTGGKPAIGLGVAMQDGANIVTLGENLKKAMRAITFELPVGIEITQIADQPQIVEHSVTEFLESFVEALAIVLVVSFISLGWRTGIVV